MNLYMLMDRNACLNTLKFALEWCGNYVVMSCSRWFLQVIYLVYLAFKDIIFSFFIFFLMLLFPQQSTDSIPVIMSEGGKCRQELTRRSKSWRWGSYSVNLWGEITGNNTKQCRDVAREASRMDTFISIVSKQLLQ